LGTSIAVALRLQPEHLPANRGNAVTGALLARMACFAVWIEKAGP
jgi:hypothetical protein